MKNKYWSRPYSKRLYEQALADVDRINYQNELNEKARTKETKKYRDLMQGKDNKNEKDNFIICTN